MAKPLTINVAANTRDAVRGAQDIGDALGEVADSLDDVGRDGGRSGDQLADAFNDSRREAGRLDGALEDLANTASRSSRTAGDDVSSNMRRGTDDAQEGIREVGEEAAGTARETAASFDGSADSIVGAFQEVAANAFAGFGPAGMIAGLAAAAGIGLISAHLAKGGEATDEFKEKVGALTAELLEVGREGGPSLEYVVDQLKELAAATEDGTTNLGDLRDVADRAGSSFEDLAKIYSGNTDELSKLVQKNKDYYAELEAQADRPDLTPAQTKAIQEKIVAQEEYNSYLFDARDKANAAAEAEANYAAAGGPEMEAKVALIEAINTAYDDAAGAVEDYISEESGLFDTEAYVTAMEAKQEALRNYQDTLASSPLSAQAKAYINSTGVDSAAQLLQGYESASPEMKARLSTIWNEAGKTSSGSYTGALKDGIPSTIDGPTVVLGAPDTAALFREAQNKVKGYGVLKIEAQTFLRPGTAVN
ncbi:hypothetical protein B0I08_101325 [Glaciihabitans tibetensis]|uniref:Uncharacterized protein n=1 Tax=Glaciihabitans tibetensis TaxID=1266600 RepID=A0A2T0VJ07_9MICO|nr:hypothetical protein [Glaciihabitans tibetensis]PRY70197.1 hypothetical protein B0I08_101325 [Glaciihabitans tibetensis]